MSNTKDLAKGELDVVVNYDEFHKEVKDIISQNEWTTGDYFMLGGSIIAGTCLGLFIASKLFNKGE